MVCLVLCTIVIDNQISGQKISHVHALQKYPAHLPVVPVFFSSAYALDKLSTIVSSSLFSFKFQGQEIFKVLISICPLTWHILHQHFLKSLLLRKLDILGWFDFLLVREFRKFTCMVQIYYTRHLFIFLLESSLKLLFSQNYSGIKVATNCFIELLHSVYKYIKSLKHIFILRVAKRSILFF